MTWAQRGQHNFEIGKANLPHHEFSTSYVASLY